ncbi:MAG: type II toxin-antitoxin system VapC family toxin [Luteolibacter sp.]|uniref:type II toxin-antitoxin system VapC family toxin n=1 Tax=Luteolibacter sp. TaxID=1962973 RepID=UPI003267157C
MIYIDTSSLLKLAVQDLQTEATRTAISLENSVIVSTLTEMEARVQLRGLLLGGKVSRTHAMRLRDKLMEIIGQIPFQQRDLPASVFSVALAQNDSSQIHCRSLDRIHLAAMSEMGIKRLMTHDDRQAKAARELGYAVIMPGLG